MQFQLHVSIIEQPLTTPFQRQIEKYVQAAADILNTVLTIKLTD